ncbi:PQ-loop repeat-containing protein [Candidatus Bathyarchaeota archaeon]|nr:PQ-loop repeat-containing protein [Candidatus Bathyarchaeota archaeon]
MFFRFGGSGASDELPLPREEQPGWQEAFLVGVACFIHGLLVIIITGVLTIAMPSQLPLWANLLGMMAGALAAVQYIPQIRTTYRLKRAGSLSIPMMCMQTPGGFLVAASLFIRLGWEGWGTWSIYIVTALAQGVVLVMAVYYECKKPRGSVVEALSPSGRSPAPGTRRRRPGPCRTYSEGFEEGLPGPYTGHPERYAETPEEFDRLQAREDRQVAKETQPLLKPGGIGYPNNGRGGRGGSGRR